MLRYLRRKGWWVHRIHGSHHILYHDDFPQVTVTLAIHGNRTMPTRAIVATLKSASIDIETYNREA